MKRILHIIATLDRAGAEKSLTAIAAGLPRDEFDVHVCALTRGGPYEAELAAAGVSVHVLGKRRKYDPRAYFELKRRIQRLRPDLVQTWMFTANAYGRRAALAAGVPHIVASEQCADPWKGWLHRTIDRRLARRSDCIVANAAGVKDFYIAQGIPAHKLAVIHGGVRPAAPSPWTRDEMLARFGLPANARVVASVGRLWPQKRTRDLIWTTDLLKRLYDNVHYLILGDGPDRESLERFRDNCQIADRVHFVGHSEETAALLPHLEFFWSASAYEGLPNAVMEAMAAGVPVVASDIPGHRELIRHGATGFLVPFGDRAEYARAGHRLLEDRPRRDAMGQAAQAFILEHFPEEKMIARHAELYRKLID